MTKKISFIEQINQKISIYELVSQYAGLSLEKKGKNFMSLCPFHKEKTPSFSVSPEKNIAVCMACHEGGSPTAFWAKLKKITLEAAAYELNSKFKLQILNKPQDYAKNKLISILEYTQDFFKSALQYILNNIEGHYASDYLLNKRKLNLELIDKFNLGYAHVHSQALQNHLLNKGFEIKDLLSLGLVNKSKDNSSEDYYSFFRDRIMFPLTNVTGQIIGFTGRSLKDDKNVIKYLFNNNTILFKKTNVLYNLFESQEFIKQKQNVILCEGIFDVIAFYKINIYNTIATLGTKLTPEHIILLKQNTNKVTIVFDGDKAGVESTYKIANLLIKQKIIVFIWHPPDNQDPDEFLSDPNNQKNFNYETLLQKSQDYVFYMIEKYLEQGLDATALNQNILNLITSYDEQTKHNYCQTIYKRYSLFIANDIYNKKNMNLQDYTMIMRQKYLQEAHKPIKRIVSLVEKEILIEILLNPKHLKLIKRDIYDYVVSNVNILKLIDQIDIYYQTNATENEIKNGIDLERFIEIDNFFISELSKEFDIYGLFLEIKNNYLFKKKIRIQKAENLTEFYCYLKMHLIDQIRQELKILKNKLQNLSEQIITTNNQEDNDPRQSILLKIAQKQKELLKLKNIGVGDEFKIDN
ncbi:MAG: DNA primase [Pigeon pea little leaf phytoplasma]|uniref:DNA primase n=2 Tax=Candidatus Phytoplasma fabacearum TaxID=2982628 RepID=A0ABU8ZST6_9MOLU|nr:DNA primase ['Bituminaria bituminosa' little leaf phytoplasma]MDV3153973.1 DNA primase [Pigeon pea little leaf phytoplasma]MDO7983705.1 DNA primase ['Bituminaria bituminosa' little leaf phytoplasma]MDO8023999.1 DNA primase ['Bituminaria bituminosa' little leaf phytoplasma]MDO8030710.1 DNA primase ['Bituminaria bituminosa' little leaf phytoplasma]MDV3158729.1 DNA primase [Pigeon pea little leaf phytoplasma]